MTNQVFDQTKNPLAKDIFAYRHIDRDVVAETWTKYHIGAFVGLMGGLVILVGAMFLTVFEYFSSERSHSFWLFMTIYPLFAVGAHCLDKISELKKQKDNISHENDTQIL